MDNSTSEKENEEPVSGTTSSRAGTLPDGSSSSSSCASAIEASHSQLDPSVTGASDTKARKDNTGQPVGSNPSGRKPFSSSAAKRESVLALGSIEHLQKFYNQKGLASKQRPNGVGGAILAIGHAGQQTLYDSPGNSPIEQAEQRSTSTNAEISGNQKVRKNEDVRLEDLLPDEPVHVSTYKRPPYPNVGKQINADPLALRPSVLDAIDETCQEWGLLDLAKQSEGHRRSSGYLDRVSSNVSSETACESTIDIAVILQHTSKTIRTVRNFLFALPHDFNTKDTDSSTTSWGTSASLRARDTFKRQSSFIGLPRGMGSSSGMPSSWKQKPLSTFLNFGASDDSQPFEMRSAFRRSSSEINDSHEHQPPTREPTRRESLIKLGIGQRPSSPHSRRPESVNEDDEKDPLVLVRRSALEVLGMLRELDENNRTEKVMVENSFRKSSVTSLSTSFASSPTPRSDHTGFPAEKETSSLNGEEHEEVQKYRSDVTLQSLIKERETVSSYVTIVNRVLSEVSLKSRAAKKPRRTLARTLGLDTTLPQKVEQQRQEQSTMLPGNAPSIAVQRADEEDAAPKQKDDFAVGMGAVNIDDSYEEGDVDLSDDDDIDIGRPQWAAVSDYPGGRLKRVRDLLVDILPNPLAAELPSLEEASEHPYIQDEDDDEEDVPQSGRFAFLNALSNGQLLCIAYNAALRQSRRPWGFIQGQEIHDVITLEKSARAAMEAKTREERESERQRAKEDAVALKKSVGSGFLGQKGDPSSSVAGWTFRRTENLKVWAAALKLRFLLSLQSTPGSTSSRRSSGLVEHWKGGELSSSKEDLSATTFVPFTGPGLAFDARVVARKQASTPWLVMLEEAVIKWAEAVAAEEREED